jgi:excisionase family DNA binding protein
MARLFSAKEAGEYLRVTPKTVRKWVREGIVPGHKTGRVYVLYEAELEELLRTPNAQAEG